MSDSDWSKLLLEEMKRHDDNHRDLMGEIGKIRDEQIEQGKTLIRNTESLEYHIKRTDILETKVTHVEQEVNGLKAFTDRVQLFITIVKPTKEKIKWLIILSTLLSGSVTLSDKDTIAKIWSLITSEEEVSKEVESK